MSSDRPGSWYRLRPDGVDIRVRLTPKGGRDGLDCVRALADGGAVLAARVRPAPQDGEANAALERLIAGALGVARATVSVASGHRARLKTVHVSGRGEDLAGALAALGDRIGGEGT